MKPSVRILLATPVVVGLLVGNPAQGSGQAQGAAAASRELAARQHSAGPPLLS